MTEYGQDILLDEYFQPLVAANGELLLTQGNHAVLQDVCLRLRTVLGTLFYDAEFGSRLFYYLKDNNTHENQMTMKAEIVRTIKMDDRVAQSSVFCQLTQSEGETIGFEAELQIVGDMTQYVLSVSVSKDSILIGVKES